MTAMSSVIAAGRLAARFLAARLAARLWASLHTHFASADFRNHFADLHFNFLFDCVGNHDTAGFRHFFSDTVVDTDIVGDSFRIGNCNTVLNGTSCLFGFVISDCANSFAGFANVFADIVLIFHLFFFIVAHFNSFGVRFRLADCHFVLVRLFRVFVVANLNRFGTCFGFADCHFILVRLFGVLVTADLYGLGSSFRFAHGDFVLVSFRVTLTFINRVLFLVGDHFRDPDFTDFRTGLAAGIAIATSGAARFGSHLAFFPVSFIHTDCACFRHRNTL